LAPYLFRITAHSSATDQIVLCHSNQFHKKYHFDHFFDWVGIEDKKEIMASLILSLIKPGKADFVLSLLTLQIREISLDLLCTAGFERKAAGKNNCIRVSIN
ncbi:MAG: hypothetical protein HGA23_08070, partial [Bacteroidales bacterium]|nr:hypothetical protein [Bacteroidales bacterium]